MSPMSGPPTAGPPTAGSATAVLHGAAPPYAPPYAPPVGGPGAPPRPAWDRAGERRGPSEPSASPLAVIAAVVVGLLLVAAVGWFTFGDDDSSSSASSGPATTLTPVAAPSIPVAGQTRPIGDGWLTFRSPDGAWLFDTPVVPSAPLPLPSNPTVLMTYGPTDFGRVGFGWGQGQVAPGSDEAALLVELMKGIALSRGATGITPTVMASDRGPVVTATLQLTGGSALFVLRSVDRRPLVAMVVADLGAPDPAVANRMLDSFRPAG